MEQDANHDANAILDSAAVLCAQTIRSMHLLPNLCLCKKQSSQFFPHQEISGLLLCPTARRFNLITPCDGRKHNRRTDLGSEQRLSSIANELDEIARGLLEREQRMDNVLRENGGRKMHPLVEYKTDMLSEVTHWCSVNQIRFRQR